MSQEQRQLSRKLVTWQQQIRQLVKKKVGSAIRSQPQKDEAENQAPTQTRVAAQSSGAADQRQTCQISDRVVEPFGNVQANRNAASLLHLSSTSGRHHHGKLVPEGAGCQCRQAPPGRCVQSDAIHARARRARMRQRLQKAEQRRAQAKRQKQVTDKEG